MSTSGVLDVEFLSEFAWLSLKRSLKVLKFESHKRGGTLIKANRSPILFLWSWSWPDDLDVRT